jgi:hypothetical protein
VPAHLRLVCFQDFDKKADTNLIGLHQVQKAQTSTISQRPKE